MAKRYKTDSAILPAALAQPAEIEYNVRYIRGVLMNILSIIFKGVFVGVANVIPGVSGGTMAVSFGIYDSLIESISGFFKHFKESLKFLVPLLAGAGLGIIAFSYAVGWLLDEHAFVTCMAFTGLILGGLPVLVKELRKNMAKSGMKNIGAAGIIAFIIAFAISAGLPLLNADNSALTAIPVTFGNMLILLFMGVIAAATMIIPGVSGSMLLMIFGYYYGIINTVTGFIDSLRALDMSGLLGGCLLLAPFGIGVVLGIFLVAKFITYLFDHFGTETYCAILGLVVASPFAIFINTGLVWTLTSLRVTAVLGGIVLLAAGAVFTYIVGRT